MEPKDLTLEVLKEIRDDGRRNGERIDETNARLDGLGETLGRRIVESELRTATAIAELAGTVRELSASLKEDRDLRRRVERCEHDIAALKQRLPDA